MQNHQSVAKQNTLNRTQPSNIIENLVEQKENSVSQPASKHHLVDESWMSTQNWMSKK